MPFPIMVCAVCGEEFELKPNKPGFANRCPDCSENDEAVKTGEQQKVDREANEARREAMKNLLYRKDS
jgi:Zn finger protein HypA/HybF involved in hydrogenase expression